MYGNALVRGFRAISLRVIARATKDEWIHDLAFGYRHFELRVQ